MVNIETIWFNLSVNRRFILTNCKPLFGMADVTKAFAVRKMKTKSDLQPSQATKMEMK